MSDSYIPDTYVSIDLETTGLNPKKDRIIEIGAVRIIDGKETEYYSTLINPGRKLEEGIVELTGIRNEELAGAPYIEDVLPETLDFIGDLPLLGHSILFDFSFLKKAAVDHKLPFDKMGIDTLKIARKYLQELEHRSLGYLCQYYGIEHHAHRALPDARATHELYGKLVGQFYKEGSDEQDGAIFKPQPLQFKVKRDVPVTKSQKERLYKLLIQHKIVLDADVERLTRSEADRFIDKILSGSLGSHCD